MNMLNKAQAQALFDANAVLFGEREGVPTSKAIAIFGIDAVEFATRQGLENKTKPLALSGFGNGHHTEMYLTLYGFYLAATYHNVAFLSKRKAVDESKACKIIKFPCAAVG